jgi:hypothetical protein
LQNLKHRNVKDDIIRMDNLLCFWDFSGTGTTSVGKYAYTLQATHEIDFVREGPVSGNAVRLNEGEYLFVKRRDCPGLNIIGKNAQVTVVAWVKRDVKTIKPNECEAVAGMWLESERKRQYCLFLNLWIHDSAQQVCGHVSGIGGPTEGEKWCMDASVGMTAVPPHVWSMVAFTYDGSQIVSYLNGAADLRDGRNPYYYPEGLFDGGENGADFTVGGVHRLGEMGNFFAGLIGGLAVFDTALGPQEMKQLYSTRIQ